VARMLFVFFLLNFSSFFAVFAVILGYDFFHAKNPNGALTIFFLIFGAVTFFFGYQLLKAFTDPLPAWLDYWLTPAHYAPVTDSQKRRLIKTGAFGYVLMMAALIVPIMGVRSGLSLERIALPLGFGLFALLLLFFLFDVSRAIYLFRKDRRVSNDADSPSPRN